MDKVVGILLSIVVTVYAGFIFMFAWSWFIVPLGVMSLGFWHSLGIITLISVTLPKTIPTGSGDDNIESLIYNIVYLTIVLGIMAFYKFMM